MPCVSVTCVASYLTSFPAFLMIYVQICISGPLCSLILLIPALCLSANNLSIYIPPSSSLPRTTKHMDTYTGFLPTTIEGSRRGNYALMDIIAALHWVHDNIAEMGGDPANITLIGHDRGAAIANLLMISPMARGKDPGE